MRSIKKNRKATRTTTAGKKKIQKGEEEKTCGRKNDVLAGHRDEIRQRVVGVADIVVRNHEKRRVHPPRGQVVQINKPEKKDNEDHDRGETKNAKGRNRKK